MPPRPGGPLQVPAARPQFQPGGPVSVPPQFTPRPGTPAPRGPPPQGPGLPQARPPPLRPVGPQSIAPQGPRPLQSPTSGQPPQRVPPPNNLQFGPRQPPLFGATTPESTRPPIVQPPNGVAKNGASGPGPVVAQLPRQPSQGSLRGLDQINNYQNNLSNLDNQSISNAIQNVKNSENGYEMPPMAKGRSSSIAAPPGAPNVFKEQDDRRKSVSAIGSRGEEFATSKSPGLGLIQEGKVDSKENVPGSQESIREAEKEIPDRPESRLSGSKMTESLIGSLSTPKKKIDDDDDVILQNNLTPNKNANNIQNQNKIDMSDRSPSLTRSEDSPEPRQVSQSPGLSNKSYSVTPEPQGPKALKAESKPEMRTNSEKETKPAVTPSKTMPKSPILDTKPPMAVHKKTNELSTPATPLDSKKSTPRKAASAPKARPKGKSKTTK